MYSFHILDPLQTECGDWSAFSQCSKTCGGGQTTRWRTCGGSIVEEKVPCNEEACPSVPENPDYGLLTFS